MSETKKKLEKWISAGSMSLLGLMIVFLVFCGWKHLLDTWIFPVGISVMMALYWTVTDVLSVRWLDSFEGKTGDQRLAYWKFAGMEAVGFAGLVWFLVDMSSMTGAIIYVAALMFKRRFKEEFDGKKPEDESAEETEAVEETSGEIPEMEAAEKITGAIPESEAAGEVAEPKAVVKQSEEELIAACELREQK